MLGAVTPLPQYVFMAWCSVKHREKLKLTTCPSVLLHTLFSNYIQIFCTHTSKYPQKFLE
jgi:hypothetical protein